MAGDDRSLDLAALLDAVEDSPPVAVADVIRDHLAKELGASSVSLLVADLSGMSLVRITQSEDVSKQRVPLDGTPHGRALERQDVQADGDRLFAPITNRGEAIGVLEVALPEPPDRETVAAISKAAHMLAYVVIANSRFTDLFEWGQRSTPLSLAAEIQRRLLPASYTCEAGQATIAGWLQPAAEVAGDTFDFSLERDRLHLSLTDAMGHEVHAALLATTVVGALRNARRGGAELEEQAAAASDALAENPGFATGQLVRIDLGDATARIVNAGHPLPLRLRDGTVEPVALIAEPPLGALPGQTYRAQDLPLEPGDRLMFITDGVLERQASAFDVAAVMIETADLHPRDAVQRLMHELLEATGGTLSDDATALCIDWHGDGGSGRTTSAGADR